TLRPAFDGRDRQELLRQIAFEEPPPPRRVDPAIPRELETVVLKAMAKEPEGRYASAQELADDLRRFLEHRPIRARRPPPAERAVKWARRHPAVVASTLMLMLTTSIVSLVSSALIARERREALGQRDEARTQRLSAEERLALAREAVDQLLTRVGEERLAQVP